MVLENDILEELKRSEKMSHQNPHHQLQNQEESFVEFKEFIGKTGVLGLAIGFIMGTVIGRVVTALVQDLIMPIPSAFIEGGDW
ncbi:MAG: MscL family protein [Thaumarchaeota archaeon]|nr:MscL family protein [Nitrososphaerota archaeon]MDE1830825.1 MscL family protein [Nitrososphaerota archaeon]MDE1840466.1 MscL family protein [Nitrososphaerota archaeon]MDE1876977.1 MscL family protein [Nitrososphaerota archaeon]